VVARLEQQYGSCDGVALANIATGILWGCPGIATFANTIAQESVFYSQYHRCGDAPKFQFATGNK
jgi:hypothetical protein